MVQTATLRAIEIQALPVTREALHYGVRELARRAGVSADQFRTWRIQFDDFGGMTLFVKPGTQKRIVIPKVPAPIWADILAGQFRISTASWMKPPATTLHAGTLEFRIPFSSSGRSHVGPLFFMSEPDSVECAVNLPLSAILTLSRFEETLPSHRDEHGRFRTASSVAWAGGFHDRPIVDEYGLALEQALRALLPGWQPARREFRVMLGHDVDEIGLPFNLRSAIAHTFRRMNPASTVRDLVAPLTGVDTTYAHLLREIVSLSIEHRLSSTVYWKCSTKGPHDTGYDLRDPRILAMIQSFRDQGVRLGVHPGYETYGRPARFASEVRAVTDLLGTRNVGGRQDFLRWDPSCWLKWEAEGLAYDASVGFADWIGFRAGTAQPYRPWLLQENREAALLEIPITAMDSAMHGYMKLSADEALLKLRSYAARCRAVAGVFHLVWHSTTMMNPGYARTYKTLLKELAGSPACEISDAC